MLRSQLTKLSLFMLFLNQCQSDKPLDIESTPIQAEIFAENIVSTHLYERDIAISPDGSEIVFTLSDYKQSKRCLVMIKKSGKEWGHKEILGFSGLYHDIEPFYALDGNTLYFASNRPISVDSEPDDFNIWFVKRTAKGWSQAEPLPSTINTQFDEFYPSLSRNNNLYFTAVRENGIGEEDIFVSKCVDGIYLNSEPLDTNINSATYEFNAYISPDEDILVFSSYGRADDLGGGDLYFSKKDTAGNWLPAKNMGNAINSPQLDFCPFIDAERNNFYFTSERGLVSGKKVQRVQELNEMAEGILNGMGNIYRIRLDKTDIK